VREIRTLRSMSGEGKRDRTGNPRLSSTLLALKLMVLSEEQARCCMSPVSSRSQSGS
jgi:hypothetical protein